MTRDVFTFGEAMLRFSVPAGHRLEAAAAYDVHVAGAELNVATALARLGRQVAWFSRLPDGPLGRRVLAELRGAGVDTAAVQLVAGARLGTYFVELHALPRRPSVIYDRAGSAAAGTEPGDVPWSEVEDSRLVHLSGITPALSESCLEASRELLRRARLAGTSTSLDINYRAKLWPAAEASATLSELADGVDLLVCSLEDARTLFDAGADPGDAAVTLAERFQPGRVVVTAGPDGAWWREGERSGHQPALPVTIVDRLGAGDAFVAGVIDGMLSGNLPSGVRTGTALAAVALTSHGDQAVATREELQAMLDGGRSVDR